MRNRGSLTTRSGYTLIEVLMVIGLMTFLAALVLGAVQGVIGTARESATKATINKISRMLEDRIDAYNRYIARLNRQAGPDRHPKYVGAWHQQLTANRINLARIVAYKDEYRRQFPQMFSEDDTLRFVPGSPPTHVVFPNWPQFLGLDGQGNPIPNPNFNAALHDPVTESAECLYYFLTQGEMFGAEPITEDAFSAAEVQDTDGDGLLEFVDSWGQPLRFYRWPTRLIRPNPDDGTFPLSDRQTILNPGVPNELDRQFKFKINETLASIVFGPLSPRPPETQGANPSFTSRFPPLNTGDPLPTLAGEFLDALARDGDDMLGLTHRSVNANGLPPFDRPFAPANFELRFHTPDTYLRPLILSAGPDEELGIFEPNQGIPDDLANNNKAMLSIVLPPNSALGNISDKIYVNDNTFGRLGQPILRTTARLSAEAAKDARLDNISSAFLRPGKAR